MNEWKSTITKDCDDDGDERLVVCVVKAIEHREFAVYRVENMSITCLKLHHTQTILFALKDTFR